MAIRRRFEGLHKDSGGRMYADVSAFIKDCDICDRERCSNPAPRASLGHLPVDRPITALYIDIVWGQRALSLYASPKSILTMIK